jgi:hypothetical protein
MAGENELKVVFALNRTTKIYRYNRIAFLAGA